MKITKKEFREWVAQHNDRQIAGQCMHTGKCMFAKFLLDTTDAVEVMVDYHEFVVRNELGVKWYDMPQWARKIADKFDDLGQCEVTFGTVRKSGILKYAD